MIQFRPVTVSDAERIRTYMWSTDRRGCDISTANLIGWQFLFNTQIAEVAGQPVFRLHFFGDLAYIVPVFDIEVIRALMADSASLGQPFLMSGVTAQMAEALEEAMPGVFDIHGNRDYSDYIYLREKLENLRGKKLQSKRNHINKFLSLYPDYEYKPLTKDMIPACLNLEKQWKAGQDDEAQADSQNIELRAITRVFHRWDQLGMSGGTIWVGGELVAFTYGCPINHNTFDVCVEKANVDFEGSFTIINREFVRHLPEQYIYINREEDMGEEGLRRAKLSYHPDILQEKMLVREKSQERLNGDNEAVRQECIQLWRESFGDPEEYIQAYFTRIFRSDNNVTIRQDGHVVAALQTIPFTLVYGKSSVPASYVSGVSVKEALRHQHYGTGLMSQAHYNMFNNGTVLSVLIPASESLAEWYGRQGYVKAIRCIPAVHGSEDMQYEEWIDAQSGRDCVLLPGREWFSLAQEELRLGGPQIPADGMIRVIDAKRTLELYASLHKDCKMTLRVVGDEDIPVNNTYYLIAGGKVLQTEEPLEDAQTITVSQLAALVFAVMDAVMSLMLN